MSKNEDGIQLIFFFFFKKKQKACKQRIIVAL
jgi:hypothetical protein